MDAKQTAIDWMTAMPPKGRPAEALSERERLAVAFHAGVPCDMSLRSGMLTLRSRVPFAIVDRGDGGYIVAQGRAR